jgi:plastocyanin
LGWSNRSSPHPNSLLVHLQRLALTLAIVLGFVLGGCSGPAPSSPAAAPGSGTVQVTIRGLAYEPSALDIPAGTTVTWVNEDVAAHDVTSVDGSFASPTLQQGDDFTWTFPSPGSWAYTCILHPEMTGVVTVR